MLTTQPALVADKRSTPLGVRSETCLAQESTARSICEMPIICYTQGGSFCISATPKREHQVVGGLMLPLFVLCNR